MEHLTSFGKSGLKKIEEDVLEKYQVEVSKRGAYKGRGEPSEWRMVQRAKKYQPRKWSEDCWARIFSYDLQRKQGMQEGQTAKEEMRQQHCMEVLKDMTRKIRAKGRMDVNHSWWVK